MPLTRYVNENMYLWLMSCSGFSTSSVFEDFTVFQSLRLPSELVSNPSLSSDYSSVVDHLRWTLSIKRRSELLHQSIHKILTKTWKDEPFLNAISLLIVRLDVRCTFFTEISPLSDVVSFSWLQLNVFCPPESKFVALLCFTDNILWSKMWYKWVFFFRYYL